MGHPDRTVLLEVSWWFSQELWLFQSCIESSERCETSHMRCGERLLTFRALKVLHLLWGTSNAPKANNLYFNRENCNFNFSRAFQFYNGASIISNCSNCNFNSSSALSIQQGRFNYIQGWKLRFKRKKCPTDGSLMHTWEFVAKPLASYLSCDIQDAWNRLTERSRFRLPRVL